jgi:hypothetical protein
MPNDGFVCCCRALDQEACNLDHRTQFRENSHGKSKQKNADPGKLLMIRIIVQAAWSMGLFKSTPHDGSCLKSTGDLPGVADRADGVGYWHWKQAATGRNGRRFEQTKGPPITHSLAPGSTQDASPLVAQQEKKYVAAVSSHLKGPRTAVTRDAPHTAQARPPSSRTGAARRPGHGRFGEVGNALG